VLVPGSSREDGYQPSGHCLPLKRDAGLWHLAPSINWIVPDQKGWGGLKQRAIGYDLLAPSLGNSALNSFLVIPAASVLEMKDTTKG